jgi:hypothetical protein
MTTRKRREENRKAFRNMSTSEKIDYIFAYYKLPIFTAVVAFIVLASTAYREITRKTVVLYTAYANISVGEDLDSQLTDGYISYRELDPKKQEVDVYRDLYLSDDASIENHEYAYACKIKVLGAISARKMDVILMNDEALMQISASGFLKDLTEIEEADPQLYASLEPYLCENTVILSDNSIAYSLGEDETYHAETEEVVNAVDVTSFPMFRNAGIDGSLYAGIIANTNHPVNSLAFLGYLQADPTGN